MSRKKKPAGKNKRPHGADCGSCRKPKREKGNLWRETLNAIEAEDALVRFIS